jgi:hypothetical protein
MTGTKPKRCWFRFSLRTLFVAVTISAIIAGCVAYHLDWIRQRSSGREWLDQHPGWGSIPVEFEARPNLPWMLKLLGEPAEKPHLIAAGLKDSQDLPEYHKRVAQMSALFPECQITDLDAAD